MGVPLENTSSCIDTRADITACLGHPRRNPQNANDMGILSIHCVIRMSLVTLQLPQFGEKSGDRVRSRIKVSSWLDCELKTNPLSQCVSACFIW